MTDTMTLEHLRSDSLSELETLYAADRGSLSVPHGRFRGVVLRWLDTPLGRSKLWRPVFALSFEIPPFGVDFDRAAWWFWAPSMRVGRFAASPGPSRFRDTETIRLDYSVSRLPLRGLLYDEVKPLSPRLCLGIGAVNRPRGAGEVFFFALSRES